MKKSRLFFAILGVILLTLIIAIPVLARERQSTNPDASEVEVSLNWAAFDDDHMAIDLIVEGDFSVSEDYLPIDCPVSDIQVFDDSGNEIDVTFVRLCRKVEEGQYVLTQFLYDDFQEVAPEKIDVYIGDIVLVPPGIGEVGNLPLRGIYSFDGPFEQSSSISEFPVQIVEKEGLSLVVNRVDFTPSLIKVDACITLPDTGDWIPDAYLLMGNERIHVDEWFIPDYKEDPQVFECRERCYTFITYTGVTDFREMEKGTISFILDKVSLNVAESINEEDLEKIRPELEKFGLPVEVDESGSYSLSFLYGRGSSDFQLDETERAHLNEYINNVLKEDVSGPLEVNIR